MRQKKRQSRFLILLMLGMALPGFIGILVVQAKAVAHQPEMINSILQLTSTPTPTLIQATSTLLASTLTPLPLNELLPASGVSSAGLSAFIQAPNGLVSRPYVILTAFSSAPRTGPLTIRGFVNTQQFVCTQSPCAIDLQSSSRLVFRAFAETGEASAEVIASVDVVQSADGYTVTIASVNQFATFTDSCSLIWGVQDETNATWDNFVQFPFQLNTRKTLHTLATQLILSGIVETNDCPAGGLSLSMDWPTACGLERASTAMTAWQNQFDEQIWLASRDQGIPPKVLKTLIEIESQFWPGNARFYIDEIGLGQVNQLGLDVLLRQDPTLYQRVCPSVMSDCSRPYLSLDPVQQAQIRGAIINLADANCPTCAYGIDLDRAKESVSLIAMLLEANCQQVDVILEIAARTNADPDADAATATAVVATATAAGVNNAQTTYEDLWRFTFVAYHSGLSCLQTAVDAVEKANLSMIWENVSKELKCKGSEDYADGFINNLLSYDSYLYQVTESDVPLAAPTFVSTRTPVPTPTVFISSAQVRVQVFMDRNGNSTPDADEWIDSMSVLLTTSDNQQITQRTQNGITIFDMTGYTPGLNVTVSLPGLYRSESFVLPEQGEVSVTFMFEQPALPTVLP